MSSLDASPITDGINGLIASGKGLLGNPIASAIGGAVVGSALTGAIVASTGSRSSSSRKSSSKKRKSSKRKSKRTSGSYARTAGKRKDRSTRRIRMTKNGQPYIITASGKAKFISKKSARASRKRKGGRY